MLMSYFSNPRQLTAFVSELVACSISPGFFKGNMVQLLPSICNPIRVQINYVSDYITHYITKTKQSPTQPHIYIYPDV